MRKLISSAWLIIIPFLAISQNNTPEKKGPTFGINSPFSYKMLEPNEDLRKVNIFMEERKAGNLKENQIVFGASLIALGDYQVSNTDSKFGYLMRHPTATNQIGKEVSEAVIHSFQLSLSGTINKWLGTHIELLYNPQQNFGTGTITDIERNQVQLRKAFLAIGDLNSFPVYGAIGKIDAPFGQTGTVSPFTNSTMWHAFGGIGYGALVGFKKWNLHATFMAVQGGAQFRALNTAVGDSSDVPSRINNFTADINYTLGNEEKIQFVAGASYVRGCAYCHEFPVFHFVPCKENNPAWTAYGRISINERLIVKGSFAKTVNVWPGTHNPTPPLNVYEASKVSSMDVGARYYLKKEGSVQHFVSGEFSNFIAGPSGAPWERQNQIVVGYAAFIKNSSKLFIELFRTDGFVPLNWISGSNPNAPFPAGETHSVRNAFSNGIIIGGQITF